MSLNPNDQAALNALNSACENKVYRGFKDLQPGEYIVSKFFVVSTKHGDRVRIEMADCFMLLPERFIQTLNAELIETLNQTPKIMVYGGKNLAERSRLILEFRDSSAYYSEMFNFTTD